MAADFGTILRIACLVVGGIGLVQVILQLLWTYESTRYFRSRVRRPLDGEYIPLVQLTLPCKGLEPNFDDQIRAVLNLDYPHYRVTFVVESEDDAAYARIVEAIAGVPHRPCRVVVAGPSWDCGQKVHNLIAATADVSGDVDVLAFADSDAVVDRGWLRRLVQPLHDARNGAVTGARWFVPERGNRPATVLAALNAGLVMTAGNHRHNLIWGGSWAIRRDTFHDLMASNSWAGSLTEDLPVVSFLKDRGLKVVFEPTCLVNSPSSGSWGWLWEFGRRQFLITRVYAPTVWRLGLATILMSQIAFWGGLIALVRFDLGRATPWVWGLTATTYGINSVRAILRQRAVATRFPNRDGSAKLAMWLDILAHPLLGLGHLVLFVGSLGREITWRGIRYRLIGPHRTEIISRPGKVLSQVGANAAYDE